MTLAELKQALDALTPEQLAMPARWWGDERGGEVVRLEQLDEMYVMFDGDGYYGYSPRSAYVDLDDDELRGSPTLPKGTPVLVVDE